MGQMEPLIGNLKTAYQYYDLQAGRVAEDETLTREETMPKYTNYTLNFQGTLDHIFYNSDRLKVTHLLEIPE
jgi:mRNA deadenylase 3'-5' endonuclease subunit Ccr4